MELIRRADLRRSTTLSLRRKKLIRLPPEIGNLSILNLSDNRLTNLPSEFENIES